MLWIMGGVSKSPTGTSSEHFIAQRTIDPVASEVFSARLAIQWHMPKILSKPLINANANKRERTMKEIQITVSDVGFNPDHFEDVAEHIAEQFPDVIGFGFQNGVAELTLESPVDRLADLLKQIEEFPHADFTQMGFQDDSGNVAEMIPLHSASVVVDQLKGNLVAH